MNVELQTATGNQHLDDLLRGLISLFELTFPARIRSYYLGGSYSDGTAVERDGSPNSSDIDLFVIFREVVKEAEQATFNELVLACRLISPIQVDAYTYSENDLLQLSRRGSKQTGFLNVLLKIAGIHVYGEDIRAALPGVPFSRYVLDVIENCVFNLSIPRQGERIGYPLGTPLVSPLAYPDPEGEFYGYDVVPARPDSPRGTRVLVAITTWIATLILALEIGRFAAQKSQSIQLCKEHLPNDRRAQLAVNINNMCKEAWRYALPEHAEDRERLHDLCRETLALENECLRLCRDYLLAHLQSGKVDEQQQATHILRSVVYRDDEIMAALKALQDSTNEAVRTGATKALEIIERGI